MRRAFRFSWAGTIIVLELLAGCAKELPPPPAPPVPQDLVAFQRPVPFVPPPPAPAPPAPPPERPPGRNEQRYKWERGVQYEVLVKVGFTTDVELEAGELVTGIFDGDRTVLEANEAQPAEAPPDKAAKDACRGLGRWNRCHVVSDQSAVSIQSVVFSTAHHGPAYDQGVTITTNRRKYLLWLRAVPKAHPSEIRTVSFAYDPPPPKPAPPEKEGVVPKRGTTGQYHVGYDRKVLQGPEDGDWFPSQCWSTTKVWCQFPPTLRYQEIPLARGVRRGTPYLLPQSAWVDTAAGPVLVIPGLPEGIEFRRGVEDNAQVVQILRGALQTIACPGDLQCPAWEQ